MCIRDRSGDLIEYYGRGDERLLRWKIMWENREELKEFLAAFLKLLEEVNAERVGENRCMWDGRIIDLRVEDLSITLTENFKIEH